MMKSLKTTGLMTLCFMILLSTTFSIQGRGISFAENQQTILELKTAVEMALQKDPERQALQKELALRALEFKTLTGQVDELRKIHGATRLTLYSKRLVEEPKAVMKELQLFLDYEKARAVLTDLESQLKTQTLDLSYKVKRLYYTLLEKDAIIAFEHQRLTQWQQMYPLQVKQYLNGTLPKSDMDALQQKIKSTQERLIKVEAEAEATRTSLAGVMSEKDLSKWVLNPKVEAYSTQGLQLEGLLSYAIQSHRQMFLSEKDQRTAQRDVEALMDALSIGYGTLSQPLIGLIESKKAAYSDIFATYLSLISKDPVNEALTFPVRMGFYSIDAPMKDLKYDWPGAAYLKDQRYPLMAALTDQSQRVGVAENVRKQLTEDLALQWQGLIQSEYDLQVLKQANALEKLKGEKLLKDSLAGKISYKLVLTSKELEAEQAHRIYLTQLKLNQQMALLEQSSGGGITALRAAHLTSPSNMTKVVSTWQVVNPVDAFGFEFTLSNLDPIRVTHYQLFNASGISIGGLKAVGDTLSARTLKPQEKTELTLVLYQKDQVVHTMIIPGDAVKGDIKLK